MKLVIIIFAFLFSYIFLSYSFVALISKIYAPGFQYYLYFNEGYFPKDEPTTIYCAKNILKTRPDRSFFYHSWWYLGIIRPGDIPPYFGVRKDNENYWWSFRKWRFVSAQQHGGPYAMLFNECEFEDK